MMSTADVIEAARRPLIVARHETAVRNAMAAPNQASIEAADADDAAAIEIIRNLAEDDGYYSAALQEGLLEQLCVAKEHGEVDDAQLGGFYNSCIAVVLKRFTEVRGSSCTVEAALSIPCGRLSRLLKPLDDVGFGSRRLVDALVVTNDESSECLAHIRRLSKAVGGDSMWMEAGGDPTLSRELEEPLEQLPEEERHEARKRLVSDRVRHRFFKKVFLLYFDRDTLDPAEIEAHPTILQWLISIEETPHLYPFMQGQTTEQKVFRLQQLWRKVVQLNELYQRVSQASDHPTYRDAFEGLDTRKRLSLLAKDRYPALKVDDSFTIATALCPFAAFAEWVQDKVGSKDFVLPPEPKR